MDRRGRGSVLKVAVVFAVAVTSTIESAAAVKVIRWQSGA
jgi:hypothetical protein